jgi:ribulose-5-phosphate 4-epimerase/fuculose-1-phosphate aldolase
MDKDYYKDKLFKDELARAIGECYRLGFLPYDGFGELSIRDAETGKVYSSIEPGTFRITTPEDYHGSEIAVSAPDGKLLSSVSKPAKGLPLHLAIYRARPDVNAIIRTHSQWASIFALRGEGIPFVLEELMMLGGDIKCVTGEPSLDGAWCSKVVETLGKKSSVLMQNYGVVAVAENVDSSMFYLGWLESVAKKAILASLLGELQPIPADTSNYTPLANALAIS